MAVVGNNSVFPGVGNMIFPHTFSAVYSSAMSKLEVGTVPILVKGTKIRYGDSSANRKPMSSMVRIPRIFEDHSVVRHSMHLKPEGSFTSCSFFDELAPVQKIGGRVAEQAKSSNAAEKFPKLLEAASERAMETAYQKDLKASDLSYFEVALYNTQLKTREGFLRAARILLELSNDVVRREGGNLVLGAVAAEISLEILYGIRADVRNPIDLPERTREGRRMVLEIWKRVLNDIPTSHSALRRHLINRCLWLAWDEADGTWMADFLLRSSWEVYFNDDDGAAGARDLLRFGWMLLHQTDKKLTDDTWKKIAEATKAAYGIFVRKDKRRIERYAPIWTLHKAADSFAKVSK